MTVLIDEQWLSEKSTTFGYTGEKDTCNQCGEKTAYQMTNGGVHQPCPACEVKQIERDIYEKLAQQRIGEYKHIMDFAYLDKEWDDVACIKQRQQARGFCNQFKCGQWSAVFGKHGNDLKVIKNMMIRDICKHKRYKVGSVSAFQIMTDIRDTYQSRVNTSDIFRRYNNKEVLFIDNIEKLHQQMVADKAVDVKAFLQELADSYKRKHKSLCLFADNKESIRVIFGDIFPGVNLTKIDLLDEPK